MQEGFLVTCIWVKRGQGVALKGAGLLRSMQTQFCLLYFIHARELVYGGLSIEEHIVW